MEQLDEFEESLLLSRRRVERQFEERTDHFLLVHVAVVHFETVQDLENIVEIHDEQLCLIFEEDVFYALKQFLVELVEVVLLCESYVVANLGELAPRHVLLALRKGLLQVSFQRF